MWQAGLCAGARDVISPDRVVRCVDDAVDVAVGAAASGGGGLAELGAPDTEPEFEASTDPTLVAFAKVFV